ncbi:hypothetical protein AS96_08415 [Microbacterium sp. MRS-1]|nr:hypothetical protein AS96_08415 [Microbacterium sp. MRS-1]
MRVERDGRELFQPIGERFGDDSDGGLDACGDLEGELPQVPFVKPGVGFESSDAVGVESAEGVRAVGGEGELDVVEHCRVMREDLRSLRERE